MEQQKIKKSSEKKTVKFSIRQKNFTLRGQVTGSPTCIERITKVLNELRSDEE